MTIYMDIAKAQIIYTHLKLYRAAIFLWRKILKLKTVKLIILNNYSNVFSLIFLSIKQIII